MNTVLVGRVYYIGLLRFAFLLLLLCAFAAHADTWRGTAPFCDGSCLRGEETVGWSDYGDGGYCVTGKKALCRNANAQCRGTMTKATCYGVVMVCENGFRESLNQVWHTCTTYGCGLCVGFGSNTSTNPQSTGGSRGGYAPDICAQGYVWREAVQGDRVCVTPATRTQAAQDNRAGPSRRQGGGASGPDTCKSGFVWREATPQDHVCVTPQTRTATREDNRLAQGRVQPAATRVVVDTCKQGFVWREAIRDDHVCVTPATRTAAANDNAQAQARVQPGANPRDACKQGLVWREVVPSDHVCVSPQTPAQAAQDNSLAHTRLAQ